MWAVKMRVESMYPDSPVNPSSSSVCLSSDITASYDDMKIQGPSETMAYEGKGCCFTHQRTCAEVSSWSQDHLREIGDV
jgi:hypothetical protein